MKKENMFYRINEDGNAVIFLNNGEVVTKFNCDSPCVWPVGSDVCGYYEHPEGIIISIADAKRLGIEKE